jgi:peroxiredoxin
MRFAVMVFMLTALPAQTPSFSVQQLDGTPRTVDTAAAPATVLVFFSSLCAVSNAYNDRLIRLQAREAARGVPVLLVNANANESAADLRKYQQAAGFPFPVYRDAGNVLADRLGARLTPEAYVLDRQGRVRYRGAIDDAQTEARVTISSLAEAVDAVVAGRAVAMPEMKSFGCTIKRVRKK